MNNLLNNLSMRGKLVTLVVPALLVIFYFAFESIAINTHQLTNMTRLHSLVELADAGDPLIETLQKERGRTAVVLSDGTNQEAKQTLAAQRRQTDHRLAGYVPAIDELAHTAGFRPPVARSIQSVNQLLANLEQIRTRVDQRRSSRLPSHGNWRAAWKR